MVGRKRLVIQGNNQRPGYVGRYTFQRSRLTPSASPHAEVKQHIR